MKSFWYEQVLLSKSRNIEQTYKFDHQRIVQAEWKSLNDRESGRYRSIGEYFQFVHPEAPMTDAEYGQVLEAIALAGPLHTDDELEILVRSSPTGFEMTSHWIFLGEGAKFNAFAPEQWNDAYSKLRELENDEHRG